MSTNKNLPEVPPTALRDHGSEERIDRVWQRIEGDLHLTSRPRWHAWLWAPTAAVIVFGSGVFVGARWFRPAPVDTSVAAEPALAGDDNARPGQAPLAHEPTAPDEPQLDKEKKSASPPGSPLGHGEPAAGPDDPAPPTASLPPVAASPEWQSLADRDDYPAAWQAVERHGGFDAVVGKATGAAQLMSLVDVARANGQRGAAIKALRSVVEKHPSDPRAALAAYTLGDMLEKAGDRAGAAKAYAAYRALSPKGDFAEDALARQVDAAIAQGNVEQAKQLVEQYAKDFPSGRRLGDLRTRVGKLAGVDAGAAAVDAGAGDDETPFDEVDDESQQKPKSKGAPGK
jgi:TolA-binding protein